MLGGGSGPQDEGTIFGGKVLLFISVLSISIVTLGLVETVLSRQSHISKKNTKNNKKNVADICAAAFAMRCG